MTRRTNVPDVHRFGDVGRRIVDDIGPRLAMGGMPNRWSSSRALKLLGQPRWEGWPRWGGAPREACRRLSAHEGDRHQPIVDGVADLEHGAEGGCPRAAWRRVGGDGARRARVIDEAPGGPGLYETPGGPGVYEAPGGPGV